MLRLIAVVIVCCCCCCWTTTTVLGQQLGGGGGTSDRRRLQVAAAAAGHQPMLSLPPPPPPPPSSQAALQQLARSPASSLLASEFFALERQRSAAVAAAAAEPNGFIVQPQPQPQPPRSPLANLSLASDTPTYSLTLDGALRLDEYQPLEGIYGYLEQLAARYKHVQVFTIGRTAEQRPIKALEIVNNATDADFVWLDALTHAREWITGSSLLYAIDRLVAGGVGGGAGGRSAAGGQRQPIYQKNYIIIPVVNPDGYVYTWTTNRMWRKNRSKSRSRAPDSKCVGADLNRNFDHSFGGEGASADPCSHIYSGSHPFSEQETRSLADLMWSLRDRIKFYLTMHSFNQLWACPYAHTTEQSAHLQQHLRVLRSIQRAVQDTEGLHYEIGPLSTSLYVGSGFGIDFAYDKCGIVHSYLVELRDRGQNGFVLPASEILPTARETFAGLRAGLRAVFG